MFFNFYMPIILGGVTGFSLLFYFFNIHTIKSPSDCWLITKTYLKTWLVNMFLYLYLMFSIVTFEQVYINKLLTNGLFSFLITINFITFIVVYIIVNVFVYGFLKKQQPEDEKSNYLTNQDHNRMQSRLNWVWYISLPIALLTVLLQINDFTITKG